MAGVSRSGEDLLFVCCILNRSNAAFHLTNCVVATHIPTLASTLTVLCQMTPIR